MKLIKIKGEILLIPVYLTQKLTREAENTQNQPSKTKSVTLVVSLMMQVQF